MNRFTGELATTLSLSAMGIVALALAAHVSFARQSSAGAFLHDAKT